MRKRRSTQMRHVTMAMALLAVIPVSASAQIATDGSLGSGPAGALTPGLDATITIPAELGATICNDANTSCNVFHSFSEFNVNAGQTAAFTGPIGIDPGAVNNVLARVTGPSLSKIDGVLRTTVMPNANFFLMNPNGVVFGPGAQLDIGGSFVVTTADELSSTDGGRFAAATDLTGSVLTTSAPSSYGFLRPDGPGDVMVTGDPEAQTHLAVGPGRSISAVGGDLQLSSGVLSAPAGGINLVSVASAGEVGFDASTQAVEVDMAAFDKMGSIEMAGESQLQVSGEGGGGVVIHGGRLIIEDSTVVSRTLGELDGQGVDIEVADLFSLVRSSIDTRSDAGGDGGPVQITAAAIVLDAREAVAEVGIFTDSLAEPSTGVAKLSVTLNISHPFDADVLAVLESPGGTRVILFDGVGGGGHDFIDTTLDDQADEPIFFGAAPFTGVFRPEDPLAVLVGEIAEGVWVLELDDTFPTLDDGVLNNWSLTIGGVVFQSTDVGQGFDGSIVVRSSLSVDAQGLVVPGEGDLTPSRAGNVSLKGQRIETFGDVTLSAQAFSLGNVGGIEVTATEVTKDGLDAQFVLRGPGAGEFDIFVGRVVLDGSLGPAAELTGPDFLIDVGSGRVHGANLFHSFSHFSLGLDQSATFTSPEEIKHILVRVTGGTASAIDGQIRTFGGEAALYLMNPSGFLFGANAQLDVGDAFAMTTANAMGLDDGGLFTAAFDLVGAELSGGTPDTLVFADQDASSVFLQGSAFQVPEQRALSIVSEGIQVDGATLSAPSGRINLVSVASEGSVSLSGSDPRSSIDLTTNQDRGDIRLDNGAQVTTSGLGGGQIFVRARDLTLEGSGPEGDTQIKSTNSEFLADDVIEIDLTGDLTLLPPAVIEIGAIGEVEGGTLWIAADRVVLNEPRDDPGPSSLLPRLATSGTNAGDLQIRAREVRMEHLSYIESKGRVEIEVDLFMSKVGGLVWANGVNSAGGKGDVVIRAKTHLQEGLIFAESGGNIELEADFIELSRTGLIGTPLPINAGDIRIRGGDLLLKDISGITAFTNGSGPGGNIDIEVTRSISINQDPEVRHGSGFFAGINAESFGFDASGSGGTVSLRAGERLSLTNTRISSSAELADAGSIILQGGQQIVLADATVTTEAGVNGGNITLIAPRQVILRNSDITAEAQENGGNVTIDPVFVDMRDGSVISANSVNGKGGNVTIFAQIFRQSNDSEITASSQFGVSGSIDIQSNLDIAGSLVSFPISLASDQIQLEPGCAVQFAEDDSSFTLTGSGGTPLRADGWVVPFNLVHRDKVLTGGAAPGQIEPERVRIPQKVVPDRRSFTQP